MNSIKSISSFTFVVALITAVLTQHSFATNMLAIEYNSKYISEGRNNLEQFDYSIGLSRLAFLKDKTFDNELTLSISREYSNQIYTAANFTYSTQQQGTFIEVEFGAAKDQYWVTVNVSNQV